MNIAIAGATHCGSQRDHNEDAFSVLPDRRAAVVADGMGGLARGEVAAAMVVEAVTESLHAGANAADGLRTAHQRIRDASVAAGAGRMGSTAVVLEIAGNSARISWVGDSRAYLWRDAGLRQLTRDHSLVAGLLDAGAITANEAEHHPNRHVLTRAVGIRELPALQIDTVTTALQAGDHLLLCTDGVYGYLPLQSVADCLRSGGGSAAIAQRLVAQTLATTEAGDNLTAVCAVVED